MVIFHSYVTVYQRVYLLDELQLGFGWHTQLSNAPKSPGAWLLPCPPEYRNDGCFMDDSIGSYQLVVAVAKVWDVNQQKSREAWTSRMYPICSMVVFVYPLVI